MKPSNKPDPKFVVLLIVLALALDVCALLPLLQGAAPQPFKVGAGILMTLAALWMAWERWISKD